MKIREFLALFRCHSLMIMAVATGNQVVFDEVSAEVELIHARIKARQAQA